MQHINSIDIYTIDLERHVYLLILTCSQIYIIWCNHFYNQDNCRLSYFANGSLGWYAVAIQVEDFISASSTVAMSSVPVQFLVLVQNITVPSNVTAPTFVGSTPTDGSCIPVNGTYHQQITARSGGDNIT